MKTLNAMFLPFAAALALMGCAGDDGSGDAPTTPQVPAECAPIKNDVVDSFGNVVAAAYQSMALAMSTDVGIDYRYGPSPTDCGTTGNDGIPTYYNPPDQILKAGEAFSPPSLWQVGGPESTDPGNYFSNMANAAIVADDPATNVGVSVFQQLAASHNTFRERPGISRIIPDGINDGNVVSYGASKPVAMSRCAGRPGWCVNNVVAFQDGLIGTAIGSNTSSNRSMTHLDANMVPTAVTLTSSGEFALVAVWDTVNVRGRVAVIALTGMCEGCDLSNANQVYWGEWTGAYPGLPNKGNYGYMKLLGYVELPDMKAPTEISATTGVNPWTGYNTRTVSDLSTEANRQSFISGDSKDSYARAGVAVVVSKSERKATFIDLRPLFAYYQKMYFGTETDFAKTKSIGNGAAQWPFTFATDSTQTPAVIKTVSLTHAPTAVKTGLWGPRRAWVATQDGQLHTFSLGNYLTPDGGGAASEIQETGSFAVGRNPTGLTYYRTTWNGGGDDVNNKLIVVSRAERKVQWIDLSSGAIERTLQDTRMLDPISADDNECTASVSPVVTIADYAGKRVTNYRYGTVIMNDGYTACQAPTGCPPSADANGGTAAFEVGGSLDLPGKAFQVSGANVP